MAPRDYRMGTGRKQGHPMGSVAVSRSLGNNECVKLAEWVVVRCHQTGDTLKMEPTEFADELSLQYYKEGGDQDN